MNLLKVVATVGGWTSVSRLLGMLREVLMSHILGVGIVSDAFVVAFKFPNFFRRFFAEGAFNAAFVPQFASTISEKGLGDAKKLALDVFSVMAFFLFIFVLIVEIFTPYLLPIIAPGFGITPERVSLAIEFTRITFPYILFISLSALLAGMLNSVNRFSAGAFAPVLLNLCMIASLIYAYFYQKNTGVFLSISVFVAGIFQFAFLYYVCFKNNLALSLHKPKITSSVKQVVFKMIPGMIGAGVMQINLFIDMQLASLLPIGAMSYLYYADRLYQLPLSVFGIAIGTALLPELSKLWKSNQQEQALSLQNKALKLSLLLNIPASLGLIILSTSLIDLFFGHGQFSYQDVQKTGPALAAFASGLPAYVACKVFTSTFFSKQDTKTPVKVAAIAILANLTLNLILMAYLEHVGLALSTSVSAYGQAFVLGTILFKRKWFNIPYDLVIFISKVIFSSLIMGLSVYGCLSYIPLSETIVLSTLSFKILKVSIPLLSGLIIYALCSYFFKTYKVN